MTTFDIFKEHDRLWLCLTILFLASIGIICNVACFIILTVKRRSSMFHSLLKVNKNSPEIYNLINEY